ncbi:MAG: hypothetical protein HKN50_01235 [Gammaproteobacteria bacterium]|nr:hypothetical protein [Gammaproteobacteria bacterium]
MKHSNFRLYRLKALLAAFSFLFLSIMPAQAGVGPSGGLEFLGQPTSIEDRLTPSGELLSDVLADINQGCLDSSLAEARDKLEKKIAKGKITEESEKFLKERAKRYFKCLKKAVKELEKDDVLAKDEEKELKDIIKAAKKAGNIDDEEPGPSSTVGGRVTLADGSTLDDVDILASSEDDDVATMTVDGRFSLNLVPDTEYVLQLSGAGLADQIVPVMAPADGSAINIEITMIERGESQEFMAGAGGVLIGDDGAAVDVTSTSWVDAEGNPVSGDIVATLTPVDVSNSALLGAFPGEFSGIAAGDIDEGAIVSLGVVEFEFTQNGAPVQPAAGELVDILIPIYFTTNQDGSPIMEGQVIPLWALNETTGIWEQDGEGIVIESPASPSGWAMLASVNHFSWWNCDVSMSAAQAIVTVFGDQPGSAVVRATTDADIGWRPNTVETVLTVGVPSSPLFIPSTGETCFSADITFDDGTMATTLEVCVNAAPNSTVTVDLFSPEPGPLNISRSPSGIVAGFVNFPIDRVRLFPTTLETSVNYSISGGALPAGLSLNPISATQAEIVGVPTEVGPFSVTVDGDNGVDVVSVTIDYDISSDEPAPLFDDRFISFGLPAVDDSYDFNDNLDLLNGGAPDFWELLPDEGGPLPDWLSFDEDTGVLTAIDDPANTGEDPFYFARIRAENVNGSDEAFFDVCFGDLGQEEEGCFFGEF